MCVVINGCRIACLFLFGANPWTLLQIRVTELLRAAKETEELRRTYEDLSSRSEAIQRREAHTMELEAGPCYTAHCLTHRCCDTRCIHAAILHAGFREPASQLLIPQ